MGNKSSKPAKKRTGKLKETEKDPEERVEAIQNLLETEQEYIEGLRAIVDTFHEPLIQSKKMKAKHIKEIFGNITTLYNLHKEFLTSLKDASTGTECREVGRVFLESVDSFKEYTNYVNNCSDGQAILAHQMAKNPKLQTFINAQSATLQNKDSLANLLMLPLQRIPRYVVLVASLVECTPPKHPDYKRCQQSLAKINEVAEFVNNEKKITENMQQLTEIENEISGTVNLVDRNREFIQEGELMLVKGDKPTAIHYFLFNDLLLLVKKQAGSRNILTSSFVRSWKVIEKEALMNLGIEEQEKGFQLTTSAGNAMDFLFDSQDDADLWLSEFYEVRARSPGCPTDVANEKAKAKFSKKVRSSQKL